MGPVVWVGVVWEGELPGSLPAREEAGPPYVIGAICSALVLLASSLTTSLLREPLTELEAQAPSLLLEVTEQRTQEPRV